ncbi:ComEC/Rec2 family competence protein [Micromonospora sp. NPDC050187]|uniref:ComEC/Rec2 family competence protein n=1 Tax=Micromonospora sp. NPDC050187 TaxID=3364277 RepID=UPI0037A714D6
MTDPTPPKRKRKTADSSLGLRDGETILDDDRRESRRKRIKLQEDQAAKLRKEAEALAKLWEDEISKRPPAAPGSRGDRKFYARMIKVGQGDCIALSTPRGRFILIDCGSTSREVKETEVDVYTKRVRDCLEDPKFLGAVQTTDEFGLPLEIPKAQFIDILVFTHSDEDHYNQLASVLADNPHRIEVGRVYHSGDFAGYGAAKTWVYEHIKNEKLIRRVIHNAVDPDQDLDDKEVAGETTLGGVAVPEADEDTDIDCLDGQGGIRIVAETDPPCTVTILTAGVSNDYVKDKDAAQGKNRGSVVLLVEVFGKKLLLCGDATRSTEHHLISRGKYAEENRTRLKGVDIVHVAHHGSNCTSSSLEFVNLLDPKERALISAGKVGVSTHHLPSRTVVERYVKRFVDSGREKKPPHSGWAWDSERYEPAKSLPFEFKAPVYITGSHGDLDITWERA